MHGTARVHVKDYNEQRYAELSARREFRPARVTDDRAIRSLAHDMADMGLGGAVVQRGRSTDGPVH